MTDRSYLLKCSACGSVMSPDAQRKCPICGCEYAVYAETPPRFEDEHPNEAKQLAEICEDRWNERRSRGDRPLKPVYLDAPLPAHAEVKVGRNDPCPCGSGRKYKKCCGN